MEKSPTGTGREVTLPAKVESITAVTAFLEQEMEALGCPEKQKMQICVAADEIVTNISMYAYAPGTGDFTVNFAFDGEERAAGITFVDEGVPFDPLAKDDPDVTLSAEERQIGGLGIFLVKKTMDGMDYRREDGKNILTIRKII